MNNKIIGLGMLMVLVVGTLFVYAHRKPTQTPPADNVQKQAEQAPARRK